MYFDVLSYGVLDYLYKHLISRSLHTVSCGVHPRNAGDNIVSKACNVLSRVAWRLAAGEKFPQVCSSPFCGVNVGRYRCGGARQPGKRQEIERRLMILEIDREG